MEDEQIIRLLFQRSEAAIPMLQQKFGGLCRSIISHILPDSRDVEECASDTYLRIWNSIPPQHPDRLDSYLARIARNTANQILHMTGLDVAVAPEKGENISCNIFQHLGLTVAETAFTADGITYGYRMAATTVVEEDFADLSGSDDPAPGLESCKVLWCDAKVGIYPDGSGKLLWFDVVPGILYCLTMDSGASEQALLDMAGQFFHPAQKNS